MKRLSMSISVFLLAFLVLLGSGGFTIGKMICGGNECASSYSLGAAKDCCDTRNESEKTLSKNCCCELINVSYALDDFSVSEKTNVVAQEFVLFHLPTAYCSFPAFVFNAFVCFQDIPPPDSQDYLHFIGALLL